MARKKSLTLTDAELRIMEVIWEKGSATVGEVAEALAGKDGSAYTTLLTLMGILRSKGYLSCHKQEQGRGHVFTPKVDRNAAARKAVSLLLTRFFGGSHRELVLSFLREEELSLKELDQLKRTIRETPDRES